MLSAHSVRKTGASSLPFTPDSERRTAQSSTRLILAFAQQSVGKHLMAVFCDKNHDFPLG